MHVQTLPHPFDRWRQRPGIKELWKGGVSSGAYRLIPVRTHRNDADRNPAGLFHIRNILTESSGQFVHTAHHRNIFLPAAERFKDRIGRSALYVEGTKF